MAAALIFIAAIGMPRAAAILFVMTLVQPTSAATMVSTGVSPRFVPPRSSGSSIKMVLPRALASVRVGDGARVPRVGIRRGLELDCTWSSTG